MSENTVNTSVENTNAAPVKVALTALQVELQMAEKLIRMKYSDREIIEGSLVQEANHPIYGNKRRVKVKCPICGAIVERATSDLFTFKACPVCIKGVRKANKAIKKVALLTALAQAQASDDSDDEGNGESSQS